MSTRRRHKQTFDIIGNSLIFHKRHYSGLDYKISTSDNNPDNNLNIDIGFIILNSKWRLNIESDELKFEKYNTDTDTFDTKFKIS